MTQNNDNYTKFNAVAAARQYYDGTTAIDVIDSLKLPFCLSTMYKYCRRLGKKGDELALEADIKKMVDYINIQLDNDVKKTKMRHLIEKLRLFPFGVPGEAKKFAMLSSNFILEQVIIDYLIKYMNSSGKYKIWVLEDMIIAIDGFTKSTQYKKMHEIASTRGRRSEVFGTYEFVKLFMKFPSKTKKPVLQQALIDASNNYKMTVENLNDVLDLLSMYEVSLKFRSSKVVACLTGMIEDTIANMEKQQTEKEQQ